MKYIVRKAVLDTVPQVEISADTYGRLRQARHVLSRAFAIEEKYEILIVNYLSLETHLLHIAAVNTVRRSLSYSEFFETRSELNIRVLNLLTAARLYLDALAQDAPKCLPDNPKVGDLISAERSKQYKTHFEYRFMEALRNHAQHHDIPVHVVQQDSRWTSLSDDGLLEFNVGMVVQRRFLEENENFKRLVLDEIKGDIDLKLSCRSYVESLSEIHECARRIIEAATKSARTSIETIHKEYARLYSERLIGLTASELDDEGREVSSVPLLLEWDDVRIELQKRNTRLVNLRKKYVTGQLMPAK